MDIDKDVLRGYSNGYPACCIAYFITEWRYIWSFISHGNDVEREYCEKVVATHNLRQGKGFGYVLCPRCLDEKSVEIV